MWLPWRSKRRRSNPEIVGALREPEPKTVRISSTPDLSGALLAELRRAEAGTEAPDEVDDRADGAGRDPHTPDVPDPRDPDLHLDFGFDGRIPVGIDLTFPPDPAAGPEEILSHSQALLEAGLAFAARQLLARLVEPASSSAKACWLSALLLWRRARHFKERDRRGWRTDFTASSWLWSRDAERLLLEAIGKDPELGEAWLSLAQLHLERDAGAEPPRIVAEALRACGLLGDTPAALLTLGQAMRAAGRPGEAVAALARIPDQAEEHAAAERELVPARLETACLAEPGDPGAHLKLGQWYLRNGHVDRAREVFARLAELAPDRAEGLYSRGRLALMDTGKSWDERQVEARRLALAALARNPRLGLAHDLLGIVANNLREDSFDHYRRAVELDPACDHALAGLAQGHVERGEIGPAIDRLEEAVRLETRNAFAYRLLALLYECTHRYAQFDRALAFRRKADDLEPETGLASDFVAKVHRLCQYEI